MTTEVKVPAFPESVTDGTIVAWHKQPGDPVEQEEVIADVETDKVVFEIPAPCNGVVSELLETEGAVVTAQQVIAKIDESASVVPKAAPSVVEAKEEVKEVKVAKAASVATTDVKANPAAKKLAQEKGVNLELVKGSGKQGRIGNLDAAWNENIDSIHPDAGILWWLEFIRDNY